MDATVNATAHDTVLAGRYRLTRRLATGGMGQVWEAKDLVLRRAVAVKILKEELSDDPTFLRRFESEARLAASVSDPGIAGVHDYVVEGTGRDQRAFLVMELVRGEPLSGLLARDPVPPLDVTLDVLVQSADALHAAHRHGVVHRDVKPANIMIDDDGRVKLTDFGIARSLEDTAVTEGTDVYGTPTYMSPEQAKGETVTPASDLYSLGVVAYQMLTGVRPFEGPNPAAVAYAHVHQLPPPLPSTVPRSVRAVVEQALSKDPESRPADAQAMATALRRPVRVPLEATQRMPVTRARRGTAMAVGTGLLATVLAAGVLLQVDDHVAEQPTVTTQVAAEAQGPTTAPSAGTAPVSTAPPSTAVVAAPAATVQAAPQAGGKPAKPDKPGKHKGKKG